MYHREPLRLHINLAFHTVYLVLFAFNLSLFRLWYDLPERFTRRYFRCLQAAGLYVYLVGYTTCLVTTVDVFPGEGDHNLHGRRRLPTPVRRGVCIRPGGKGESGRRSRTR